MCQSSVYIIRAWFVCMVILATFGTPSFAQENEAEQLRGQCGEHQHQPQKRQCYHTGLEKIIRTQGTEHALATLATLTRQDPDVLRNAHHYAHHLGRTSFAYYKDVTEAFAHCRETFGSGCYHGVLEGYLRSLPEVRADSIAAVCTKEIDAWQSTFLQYQCLHGLGHGLTLYFDYHLPTALEGCDALASPWERESCYSGVFMENVVAFLQPHHTHQEGDHHADRPRSLLRPEDPLYPCNAVDEAYQRACYRFQSSAILTFSQHDFAKAFQVCSGAPTALISVCYESLGRDVSGFTLRDVEKTMSLCQQGGPEQATACLVGAVKDFINNYADPQRGLAFCRRLDDASKEACYAATGEMLLSLYPDNQQRAQSCAQAETEYIDACKEAAAAL